VVVDAELRQDGAEQLLGGAEEAVGRHDVLTRLHDRHHSDRDRRHAGGRGDAGLAAFERREAVLQHADGRVGEAP
jgi:hypothetical protein